MYMFPCVFLVGCLFVRQSFNVDWGLLLGFRVRVVSWCLMPYFVYVLLCDDGSYYTGYTRNVNSRLRLHVNGRGARYTRIHKPKKLVYTEEYPTRAQAMKRERRLKKLKHEQKSRLIHAKARKPRKTVRHKR